MNEVVAQTAFDGVDPGGARFRITVEIGRPWPIDDGDGAAYARCPVSVVPILNEKDIAGQDTFQALCLAVRFAQRALQAFSSDEKAAVASIALTLLGLVLLVANFVLNGVIMGDATLGYAVFAPEPGSAEDVLKHSLGAISSALFWIGSLLTAAGVVAQGWRPLIKVWGRRRRA